MDKMIARQRYFRAVLPIAVAAIICAGCASSAAQTGTPRSLTAEPIFDSSCNTDRECKALPELWPACSHYCDSADSQAQGKREICRPGTHVCAAYSRIIGDISRINCFVNAPCLRPDQIRCVDNECTAIQ